MNCCNVRKKDFSRKDNLSQHQRNTCRAPESQALLPVETTHSRPYGDISVCSSFPDITKPAGKVNPKIQSLVNAVVINDGIEDEPTSEDMKVPAEKKIPIAVKKIDKKKRSVPQKMIDSPSEDEIPSPKKQRLSEQGSDENDNDSVDDVPCPADIRFLPESIEDLEARAK